MTQPKIASKSTLGSTETDWRPKQMHSLPHNHGRPACGCYVHYGMNFSEWIFCPLHAKAPEMYELLLYVLDEENMTRNTLRQLDVLKSITIKARRLKAEIDGESKED